LTKNSGCAKLPILKQGEFKMTASKQTSLFEEFMASSVVVKYPCNKHACKNNTKPQMVTKKDLAHILRADHSRLVQTKTERQ
jgi:hypothetical protein